MSFRLLIAILLPETRRNVSHFRHHTRDDPFGPLFLTSHIQALALVGYIVSILLVIGCAGGTVISRRAEGGDISIQLEYYILASGAAASVVVGCVEGWRRAFDTHREWILRAWIYNGALITPHATVVVSARVVLIGGYYTNMRCSEINYLETLDPSPAFPECSTTTHPDNVYVSVLASWSDGKLGESSRSARLPSGALRS
ncbi:unnamed protein product [Rhizoctonia solani]|uniref:Uncharacterized protein n=1 Tax=Rhizoctonia solani TaxID=456999 RepID=A0A8H3C867_9AGAM|nr:unnamed protein product [Rhizoctonia solani]